MNFDSYLKTSDLISGYLFRYLDICQKKSLQNLKGFEI